MKLAFVPGDLYLGKVEGGYFLVRLKGEEVLRTRSQRAAIAKFSELRRLLENDFPVKDLSPGQKSELMNKVIGDSLVGHNSLGGRKKKSTAGSTRTFGG